MVWCGVVWCGVVWCGVIRCGVVWFDVVWQCEEMNELVEQRDVVRVNMKRQIK